MSEYHPVCRLLSHDICCWAFDGLQHISLYFIALMFFRRVCGRVRALGANLQKGSAFCGIWTHAYEYNRTWVEPLRPLGQECCAEPSLEGLTAKNREMQRYNNASKNEMKSNEMKSNALAWLGSRTHNRQTNTLPIYSLILQVSSSIKRHSRKYRVGLRCRSNDQIISRKEWKVK